MVNRGQQNQNMSGIKAMEHKIIVVERRSIWWRAGRLMVGLLYNMWLVNNDGACQGSRVQIEARS